MLTLSAIVNLGRDPEMSYTGARKAVTRFSVACSRRWKDQTSGERKEETIWLNCTAFDRLGETINEYLHKGSKVYIEGRPAARAWTGRQGDAQASLDVIVSTMEILDSRAGQETSTAVDRPSEAEEAVAETPF
jgi:single-strand DNA-binding protein